MKKKKNLPIVLALFILLGLFSFTNKNNHNVANSKNVGTINNYRETAPARKWTLESCRITENGTEYYGSKCSTNAFGSCPKQVDCKKIKDHGGNDMPCGIAGASLREWGFSDNELEAWDEGENVLTADNDFVKSHYDFYLAMHEQGITFHPDDIIKRNQ